MSKKVCLIDGSGYIFRAFYALPATLTTSKGLPVNAVLGFMNMFMRLTAKIKCDYCLVLFDAKRQNFRNDIFPDYKGTRREIPPELVPQFSIIRDAVDVLNLNHFEMEGYEADDLIATYARQSVEKGFDVVIVSADKDLMQLIEPHVEFYDSMKDKFFTPEDVKIKFGVYPEKMIDVQSLAGDSTDNVPGVPGIGLKTAAELINTFGSLDEVLSRASEIKQNKRRETILANIENAQISRQLVTLKKDVDVLKDIESFTCRPPQMQTVLNFVDEYELKSIRQRVEKWVMDQDIRCAGCTPEKPAEITAEYKLIDHENTLSELINQIRSTGFFAFKTETKNEKNDLIGLSISTQSGHGAYIPLKHLNKQASSDLFLAPQTFKQLSMTQVFEALSELLTDRSILKIGQNIKEDLHVLTAYLKPNQIIRPIEDISVISYDLDSSEHGHSLAEMSEFFLNKELIKCEDICINGKKQIPLEEVSPQDALFYEAQKADMILRLYDMLKPRLATEKKTAVYEYFDRPLIPVLKDMEAHGIMLDTNFLMQLDVDFSNKVRELQEEIYKIAGEEFNIASPKQIGEILYEKLGLKGKKKASGRFNTGAEMLEQLAEDHILPEKILEWRAFSKLQTTYTKALLSMLDDQNRVHTTFTQIGVNTGRLASSNPNLQNIPVRTEEGKKIRRCFIAKKGHKLISADYSQAELRLLASVADVKGLKEAFHAGVDIHASTASKIFNVPLEEIDPALRRHAKAINFGIIYGISAYGLAKQIDTSAETAKKYIDSYFEAMPEIKEYMNKTIEFAHQNGFVLTPYGRKCYISGINSENKKAVSFSERAAINAPIQGGAADIIKLAMISIAKELKEKNLKTKMLLQVHDELVFEAPDEEVEIVQKIIKENMESVVSLDVPFIAQVGVGNNWADAH